MQMPRIENKVNWTTVIAAASFLLTIAGLVYVAGQFTARTEGLQTEFTRATARTEARLDNLEVTARSLENLAYRVTLIEQSSANTIALLNDMRDRLASQGADIRVIRDTMPRAEGSSAP